MKAHDWLQLERLDTRWRQEPPPAPEPAPHEDAPLAWCARLQALAVERFGAGAPVLRVLAELARLVEERFTPRALEAEVAAELECRIAEYVTHVEDLADVAALESGR